LRRKKQRQRKSNTQRASIELSAYANWLLNVRFLRLLVISWSEKKATADIFNTGGKSHTKNIRDLLLCNSTHAQAFWLIKNII
jgi:hypothetical protein